MFKTVKLKYTSILVGTPKLPPEEVTGNRSRGRAAAV